MIKKSRIRLWAFWKVGSGPERSRKSDPAMRVLESRICMALSILESRIRPWAFWKVGLIRAIWKSCPYSVKWCQEPQQHGYKLRDQRLLLKMHLLINSLYICTLFFRCVINLLIYIVHRTGNAAAYGDSEISEFLSNFSCNVSKATQITFHFCCLKLCHDGHEKIQKFALILKNVNLSQ